MGINIFEIFGKIGAKDEASPVIDSVVSKARSANSAIASSFSKIGSAATNIGGALTAGITVPAIGAATALGGIVIGKGWGRLTAIDNAQAKLYALGNSAQDVEQIMNDANASVKGTAFGLEEAATTAAGAVAAGIEPGKELEQYLGRVADTAAIAGISMSEMGSIVNKVTTGGMAQAEELNQLADRGIPIFQMLGEVMGVSADEVKGLASEGKVTSDVFMEALGTLDGAAAKIGELSISSAWDNFGAALGRIGANFLQGDGEANSFFNTLKNGIGTVTDMLGPLEEKASEAGAVFGEWFSNVSSQIGDFISDFQALDSETQSSIMKMIGGFAALAVAIGPFLTIFGAISSLTGVAMNAVGSASGVLAGFGAKIAAGATGATSQLALLGGKVATFGAGALNVFGALLGTAGLGALLAGLGLLQMYFGDQLDAILEMVTIKGPQVITSFVSGITSRLPELITLGTQLVMNLAMAISANLPYIIEGGAQILASLITGVAQNLPQLFQAALMIIQSLLIGIINALPHLIMAGLQLVQGIVLGIIQNLPTLITAAMNVVTTFINTIGQNLPAILQKGVEVIQSLRQGMIDNLPEIISAAVEAIISFATAIAENLPQILAAGVSMITELVSGMVQTIPEIIALVPGIFSDLVSTFQSYDWGSIGINIVQGIINGLSSMIGSLVSKAQEMASSAWNAVTGFFSMKSPSRLTDREGGVMIVRGLINGMDRMKAKLVRTARDVASWANPLDYIDGNTLDYQLANRTPISHAMTHSYESRQSHFLLERIAKAVESQNSKEFATYLDKRKVSRDLNEPMKQEDRFRTHQRNRLRGDYV